MEPLMHNTTAEGVSSSRRNVELLTLQIEELKLFFFPQKNINTVKFF